MNHPRLNRLIAERLNQQEDNQLGNSQRFNQLPFAVSEEEEEENNPIVIYHLGFLASGIGPIMSFKKR